jgi:aminopeptidase-like protein
MKKVTSGDEMYAWAEDLFPICRSLTGSGVRDTLSYLKNLLPTLNMHEIKTGENVLDWQVPLEWDIKDAYIENEKGKKIIDFNTSNLHVVGYSEPIDTILDLAELQKHLHSLPSLPNAIPYITSYYSRNWGFCLSHEQRLALEDTKYHAVIDSELKDGVLNYSDLVIKGQSSKEVLLSTYVCHPSMGNNELSGPIVSAALAKWINSLESPYYTYRFIFIPETIGSIVYLSQHMEHLKSNVIAGFNITCVGDDRCYSFLPSRNGSTLADRVGKHVLSHIDSDYKQYTWLDRGSDERQYCAPGVDLPIATIMRSKYDEYPEYHTSLDDLSLISPAGLRGGLNAFIKAIEVIEFNCFPKAQVLGEPQLGKRGLYPETSTKESTDAVRTMMDFTTYADGEIDLLEIAEKINVPIWELYAIVKKLVQHGLISISKEQK